MFLWTYVPYHKFQTLSLKCFISPKFADASGSSNWSEFSLWTCVEFIVVLFVFTGSDVAAFEGSGHFVFRQDPSAGSTDKDVFKMNFKTLQSSGMLVHMEGFSGLMLTVELFKGKLLLQLRKGTNSLVLSEAFTWDALYLWQIRFFAASKLLFTAPCMLMKPIIE